MKKLYCFLFSLLSFLLLACFDDDLSCYPKEDFSGLNFISDFEIDSVRLYIGGKSVCENTTNSNTIKNPSKYGNLGRLNKWVLCKTSEENNYLTLFSFSEEIGDSCLQTEDKWNVFICTFNQTLSNIDLSTGKLNVQYFYGDFVDELNFEKLKLEGLFNNVVFEKDTTRLFSYTEGTILPYFDNFISPSEWTRIGCADGYCIATQPMLKREFCYEQ